jgi:hypothetical protein
MENPMKRTIVLPLSGVAAVLAIATVALPAAARSVPVSSGHATWGGSDTACFSPWYESETNNCSTQKGYTIPLVIDQGGTYFSVTVTAYGASSSNNVGCAAVAVDDDITSVWGGQTFWLSGFGAPENIALGSVYMPPSGTMFVSCSVDPGGRINAVNWTW